MLYRAPPSENPLGIEPSGPGRGGVLVEIPQGFPPFAPRSRYGWGTSVGNRRCDNTHPVFGAMSIAHNPLPPAIPPYQALQHYYPLIDPPFQGSCPHPSPQEGKKGEAHRAVPSKTPALPRRCRR